MTRGKGGLVKLFLQLATDTYSCFDKVFTRAIVILNLTKIVKLMFRIIL